MRTTPTKAVRAELVLLSAITRLLGEVNATLGTDRGAEWSRIAGTDRPRRRTFVQGDGPIPPRVQTI